MSIRVGFIGLGNQGKPIASHLVPAGFETRVYDVVDAPVQELVAGGAKAAADTARRRASPTIQAAARVAASAVAVTQAVT